MAHYNKDDLPQAWEQANQHYKFKDHLAAVTTLEDMLPVLQADEHNWSNVPVTSQRFYDVMTACWNSIITREVNELNQIAKKISAPGEAQRIKLLLQRIDDYLVRANEVLPRPISLPDYDPETVYAKLAIREWHWAKECAGRGDIRKAKHYFRAMKEDRECSNAHPDDFLYRDYDDAMDYLRSLSNNRGIRQKSGRRRNGWVVT